MTLHSVDGLETLMLILTRLQLLSWLPRDTDCRMSLAISVCVGVSNVFRVKTKTSGQRLFNDSRPENSNFTFLTIVTWSFHYYVAFILVYCFNFASWMILTVFEKALTLGIGYVCFEI